MEFEIDLSQSQSQSIAEQAEMSHAEIWIMAAVIFVITFLLVYLYGVAKGYTTGCDHEWDKWEDCTGAYMQERACKKCGFKESRYYGGGL